MTDKEIQLKEEQRVGNMLSKTLASADATNETVLNVLLNMVLSLTEAGAVSGSISSNAVTITVEQKLPQTQH